MNSDYIYQDCPECHRLNAYDKDRFESISRMDNIKCCKFVCDWCYCEFNDEVIGYERQVA